MALGSFVYTTTNSMNQLTPLPQVDATLDSLVGSIYFTNLNLDSDYWQMELEPGDKKKTAFSTSKGHLSSTLCPSAIPMPL